MILIFGKGPITLSSRVRINTPIRLFNNPHPVHLEVLSALQTIGLTVIQVWYGCADYGDHVCEILMPSFPEPFLPQGHIFGGLLPFHRFVHFKEHLRFHSMMMFSEVKIIQYHNSVCWFPQCQLEEIACDQTHQIVASLKDLITFSAFEMV
jgi:hypothetical protein